MSEQNGLLRFPTVAANWEHFATKDISPNAPEIQRSEMKRAFMAGVSSGLVLAIVAHQSQDVNGALLKINAELGECVLTRSLMPWVRA